MKIVKYLVDRHVRRAGEVRQEEDGVADMLIHRGFAEETDEQPDAGTGEAQAIAQYDPEGSEPVDGNHNHAVSLPSPAGENAPGQAAVNALPSEETDKDADKDADKDKAASA